MAVTDIITRIFHELFYYRCKNTNFADEISQETRKI